ncbi:MAG TPA: tRNA pseudouridine(38-40) synthase TruA [Chryseolinea sp.]|nr:tRNA pseudouridine(38-40) synthase TruA [Chryseolinea sp.]
MRYFFEIAYNGKNYAGWQTQITGIGVQSVVENALGKICRQDVKIFGSGRTDTGVHCEQQFFHVDLDKEFDSRMLVQRLNSFLPIDIAINSVQEVKIDISARHDAIERTYQYRITRKKDPLLIGLAWHYFKDIDIEKMNKAAAFLLGEHDYECFSKVKTQVNHFLCDIKTAGWKLDGNLLVFTITANRFLRGMVRAIVGTLLNVGNGKTSMKEFQMIIQSRDRKKAGANVPPYGLYLTKVKYPAHVFIR